MSVSTGDLSHQEPMISPLSLSLLLSVTASTMPNRFFNSSPAVRLLSPSTILSAASFLKAAAEALRPSMTRKAWIAW